MTYLVLYAAIRNAAHYELWHSFREVHKVSTWRQAYCCVVSVSLRKYIDLRSSKWVGLVVTCHLTTGTSSILICSLPAALAANRSA